MNKPEPPLLERDRDADRPDSEPPPLIDEPPRDRAAQSTDAAPEAIAQAMRDVETKAETLALAAEPAEAETETTPSAGAVEEPLLPHMQAMPGPCRIGVLLVNLGTPDATDPKSVRRYLRQFLTDRRVIEKTGLWWKFILNAFILRFRPGRSGRKYEKIWDRTRNESPLTTITRSQADKLAMTLQPLRGVAVDWAMRYGNPSLRLRIESLVERGCERLLVMPLYPQYAGASTGSVCDEVFRALNGMRRQPSLRVLPPYYDDPIYIEALASSLETELSRLSFKPDVILASYHGIPKSYADAGDPYPRHCEKTTELLRRRLNLPPDKLMMSYQSRFGRSQWLEPYTDQTVKQLARDGVKNLVLITPGFVADCLETLEEIAIENANLFRRHRGENFAAIPCLNDSEPGMLVLWELAVRELRGWV
jgi:ferrochelatase